MRGQWSKFPRQATNEYAPYAPPPAAMASDFLERTFHGGKDAMKNMFFACFRVYKGVSSDDVGVARGAVL